MCYNANDTTTVANFTFTLCSFSPVVSKLFLSGPPFVSPPIYRNIICRSNPMFVTCLCFFFYIRLLDFMCGGGLCIPPPYL